MTPGDYRRSKAAGGVTVARLNEDTVSISTKFFDKFTGETQYAVDQVNIKEVKAQLAAAEAGVAALREFVADMEATEVLKPLAGG